MAQRTFLGTLRLAVLLAVLVFVALGAWLDRQRSRDWDVPLRITIYPIAASSDGDVRNYVASLTAADFEGIERFFADEGRGYGLGLEQPVRIRVSRAAAEAPPALPDRPGALAIALWSLRLRWFAARVAWNDPLPTPDIQAFATFARADGRTAVPDSVGLSKGLIAVAHLYAARAAAGSNRIVLTHELLHTLGATDKYERDTGLPLVPSGLGDPDRDPMYPQDVGEIMAGRLALSARQAVIPDDLDEMVVGEATAREIGWTP